MRRRIKEIAAVSGLILILLLLSDAPASATPETTDLSASGDLSVEKRLIQYNVGGEITPEYLVIHETDNYSSTATAQSHADWNDSDPEARSSAHFYVDDQEAVQTIEMNRRANTVGGNTSTQEINNNNVIAIEMCVNEGSNYQKTIENTIRLIREHILPEAKRQGWTLTLARHKDAWGKNCPQRLISGKWGINWEGFIDRVFEGLDYPRLAKTDAETAKTSRTLSIMGYVSFDREQAKKW